MSSPTCPLSYPHKYEQAKTYVKTEGRFNDEATLVLNALEHQVAKGPCQEPKPNPWNEGRALWEAWTHLGNMSKEDAMRLYVKQIELDQPNWWREQSDQANDSNGVGSKRELKIDDDWTILVSKGPKPRYEHCSICMGDDVFIIGGRYSGRYLKDAWKFNLKNKTWVEMEWKVEDRSLSVPIPPCAAGSAVQSGKNILLIGGHLKPDCRVEHLNIYSINTSDLKSTIIQTFGDVPTARGGHSTVSLKGQLFLFGGEETASKRMLGELYVFDIHSQTWSQPSTTGRAPCARSAHSATAVDDRFMVIFGGGSVSHCFNDIYVLDTENMEWFNPNTVGNIAVPRAGHASVLLGKQWYIIGGGNNLEACTDSFIFDLSTLESKSLEVILLGNLHPDTELSSEGTSFVKVKSTTAFGFGGYNGKYLDRICLLNANDKSRIKSTSKPIASEHPINLNPTTAADKAVPPATTPKSTENLADQLVNIQAKLSETKMELSQTQDKLKNESKKCMHLEVENAELKQKLSEMEDLQKTLDAYQKKEESHETVSENGAGFWGYISGA